MTDEELVATLVKSTQDMGRLLQPGNGAFQLQTLLAIKRWAIAQQPVRVSDRVEPAFPLADERRSPGWMPYRDLLRPGNVGVVEAIHFNLHSEAWQAEVRFDSHPDACFSINVARLRKVWIDD